MDADRGEDRDGDDEADESEQPVDGNDPHGDDGRVQFDRASHQQRLDPANWSAIGPRCLPFLSLLQGFLVSTATGIRSQLPGSDIGRFFLQDVGFRVYGGPLSRGL
jgi:hypothetical protein